MFGRKKKQDAAAATDAPEAAADEPKKKGWLGRLVSGLSRSSDKIKGGIDDVIERAPVEPAESEAAHEAVEPPSDNAHGGVATAVPEPAVEPPVETVPPAAPPAQATPEPVHEPTPLSEPAHEPADRREPTQGPESAEEPPARAEPTGPLERAPEPEAPPPAAKQSNAVETAAPQRVEAPEPVPPAPAREEEKAKPASAEADKPDRATVQKRSGGLIGRIARLVTRRKLDDAALEEIEDVLIMGDLGPSAAAKLTANLAKSKFDKAVSSEEIREALADDIAGILAPIAQPLELDASRKPHVVLVVGVNGSGKTTTIGKLAKLYVDDGRTVSLAAGDTFRAAAVEQLQIWGERTGAPVVARDTGADAAGLAYDALDAARGRGDEVLLIDTAGRLQNKADLMGELQKIVRVLRKIDESAPHSVLLVLDATVGQNAHSQVEVFREMAEVSGLVVTKLDGSAKGGVIVALAEKFGLPIHAIGVGEAAEDLRPFDARDFARGLMGLER